MRRRQSKFSAAEETVDIETAVRMIITRLLETEAGAGTGKPKTISRKKLTGLIEQISKPESPPGLVNAEKVSEPHPEAAWAAQFSLATRPGGVGDPKAVLTPHSLANAVAPYVNAIINIQYAINEVRGAPHQKIRILEIQGRPPIVVKLDGAEEVVGMIKEFVIPWRKQNTDRLRHGSARTFQADPGQNTIEQAKIDLATQIIERVSPDISEKDKITCLASLLPPLTALLFSEFELE